MNLTLSPAFTTLHSGRSEQFTSSFRGTSDTAVEWTETLGKISSSGLFTAPSVTTTQIAVVKATSVADPNTEATATITITPPASTPPPTHQPQPPSLPTGADNRYCNSGDQPHFGSTDGPANLPQRCIYTALSSTPSGGKKVVVLNELYNSKQHSIEEICKSLHISRATLYRYVEPGSEKGSS